jgi:hypothetical protein
MQCNFKSVEEASSKNGIVGVEHVDAAKSDVLGTRVLWGAERHW